MIEDGLDAPWPDGVIAATNQYLQGHLIEKPPFFYAANLDAPVWQLSRAAQEDVPTEERSDAVVELDADQRPLYGIITSQSCDLAEERPDPRQPWFLVAPVYALPPDSPLKDREYIVAIAPPTLPVGCWVADLRVEFPLEKSMLVGRVPIEAFADEAAAIEFAGLLARRRGRPALASVFHEVLNTTMRELKEEDRSAARNVRGKVYKLMLAIEDGTRLKPIAAKLHVVTRGGGERPKAVDDWFGAWWDRARGVAASHGLQLHPIGWMSTETIDLELYDDLAEVRSPL